MSYFNNRFNSNRFVDVSTESERNRGIHTFSDMEQPGVYYSENNNGRVYRKIRRKVIVQDRVSYTTSEYSDNTTYCINPRVVPVGLFLKLIHRVSLQVQGSITPWWLHSSKSSLATFSVMKGN